METDVASGGRVVLLECLNCGDQVDSPSRLFCDEPCRQEAKAVRYARAATRDGRAVQPDVWEAIQIKLGFALAGGYPEKERRLFREEREAIFERDGWRCRLCGGPATQIDHLGSVPDGEANHPDNLQAICEPCHRSKTLASFKPVTDPEQQAKADELWERVQADQPLRICDDEKTWESRWKQLLCERRATAQEPR